MKPQTTTVYVIDEVICNCCGKPIPKTPQGQTTDYLHIHKRWGYGTSLDSQEHSFDLCDVCYKKWLDTFKIPPENENNVVL
jgi:hypothetical protein